MQLNNINNTQPTYRNNFKSTQTTNTNSFESFTQGIEKGTTNKFYLKLLDEETGILSQADYSGRSYYLEYAEESTPENPIINAIGVDSDGTEFNEKIEVNSVDPRNATYLEFMALSGHMFKNDDAIGNMVDITFYNPGSWEHQILPLDEKMNFLERTKIQSNYHLSSPFQNNRELGKSLSVVLDRYNDIIKQRENDLEKNQEQISYQYEYSKWLKL